MTNIKQLDSSLQTRMDLKRRVTLLRICFAAFIELGETDLEGLAIKKVMAKAEFAFNTFYNYFGDRETLMANVIDEIVVPWRAHLIEVQGPFEDEAVKLGFLMRGWIREFARDSHFARFSMRNGAFIHKSDSESNRDAVEYFKAGANKGLFVLPPVESKYLSLGILSASAALILRERADDSFAERMAERTLVMLGLSEKRARAIVEMPMIEIKSLDFIFQKQLEIVSSHL
mgnify:CR=1 FL=1